MTTVFITPYRRGFRFILKIHLATTARENVVSSGKEAVGENLFIQSPGKRNEETIK